MRLKRDQVGGNVFCTCQWLVRFHIDDPDFWLVPMQIWRMSDLIYRPEEEVLAELEKFKAHVLECSKV